METHGEMSSFRNTFEALRMRLEKVSLMDHPYPFRPIYTGRPASVLILVGQRKSAAGQEIQESNVEVLITRRTVSLETHKGQYALPGGSVDPEDGNIESESSRIIAALRETEEEVGISREWIEPLGTLPSIWTPSGFLVTPVVGLLKKPIEEITVTPSVDEIDFWFWCGLDRFQDATIYSQEMRKITHAGISYDVPVDVFQVGEHRVWGATAAILKNFIGRWEKLS